MSNINELLTSVILYCLISYVLKLPNFYTGLLITALSSQISTILPYNYRNSLAAYVIPLAFITAYPNIISSFIIGYSSSILISLLSKKGCKLLYPIRDTTFTGPHNYLENDTKGDYAATTFLLVLSIVAIIFSIYGTAIIDDISENNDVSTYFSLDNAPDNSSMDYVEYINIDPAECLNMNITTTKTDNTTTTIISPYESGST